jgi:hypothetical protein
MNRIRSLTLLLVVGCLGCGASYHDYSTVPSPDGLRIVDVVTEDQGANDPDPIWQHVSIRRPTDLKPVLPGNVMVCSCYSRPEVTWLDNSTVSIVIGGTTRNFQLDHGIRRKIRAFHFTKKFERSPRYAQTFLFRKKPGFSVSVLAPN